jgi:formate dehydrogenase iron-sulfur subunit
LPLGADRLAIRDGSKRSRRVDLDAEIVRNGSRGLYWLEPMVEVETGKGRVAYGPVKASDVDGLLDAGLLRAAIIPSGSARRKRLPFLKRQTRLTFARCGMTDPLSLDDYREHGGLAGLTNAVAMSPEDHRCAGHDSACADAAAQAFRPASSGRRCWRRRGAEIHRLQRRRGRFSGTFADRMIMEGDPFVLIEGMVIAGIATGATKGYVYLRSEYPARDRA